MAISPLSSAAPQVYRTSIQKPESKQTQKDPLVSLDNLKKGFDTLTEIIPEILDTAALISACTGVGIPESLILECVSLVLKGMHALSELYESNQHYDKQQRAHLNITPA